MKNYIFFLFSFVVTLDEDREETIRRINAKLPTCIRVQTIKKVTKNFNAKSAADNRTYIYFLPTYAFAPIIPSASVSENNETQEESQENFKRESRLDLITLQRVINIWIALLVTGL